MNKTLFGLALISFNWETHKKDIIDSYVPLVSNIIVNKSYSKINRDIIKNDLLEIYGILVPLGAVENILKRMSRDAFLTKGNAEYLVNFEKVSQSSKNSQKEQLDIAFKQLVIDLQKYSVDTYEIKLSMEEVESGLVAFFKENDLDMLYASDGIKSILPDVKENKKTKYIIAKFIIDLQNNTPTRYSIILKLAQGYSIASLITYDGIQNYSGSLSDVQIFLDAPIIFNIIGINGESNSKLSNELIQTLKLNGATLKVFEINYQEVVKTIQDAIKRLTSKDYDITKSSRILRTAIRENISPQQLQIKLNQIDSILLDLKIIKTQSVSLLERDYRYQINEKKLAGLIEEIYKKDHEYKISWYKKNQIEKDVQSISNIFKLRKSNYARSLKNSKALLLTSNSFIAFAAKAFEKNEWAFKSAIPICVTDIFLSTILWANYPVRNDNLNIKKLMSECYSIIELDNRLLNKYYEDVERMHKESAITEEQFYLLSATNLAYTLLETKTLNDFDEYTDQTPSEILEGIELKIKADLIAEQGKVLKIDRNIKKMTTFIAKSVFVAIGSLLILIFFILKAINPQLATNTFGIIMWSISGIVGIFGFLRWFEIIPTKIKIESSIWRIR